MTIEPLGGLESPALGEVFLSGSLALMTVNLPLQLGDFPGNRTKGGGGMYDVAEEEDSGEDGDCDEEDKRNEESFNVKDDIAK